MRIDGKQLATSIYDDLTRRTEELKRNGIVPELVVFLVGDDPSSVAYVGQKEKFTKLIGGEIIVERYPADVDEKTLQEKISLYNDDLSVHGLIVQLPVPKQLDGGALTNLVSSSKDIDGFKMDSAFNPPIAEAVEVILRDVHEKILPDAPFLPWSKNRKVAIIGKGETGGKPIAEYFTKLGIPYTVIDSKTEKPDEILKSADVIVSAVGKSGVLKKDMIKKGATLICIGMYRGEDGKLHGDYEEDDVLDTAGYYTPVPGGVGPVNVAMLLTNLIKGAERRVT